MKKKVELVHRFLTGMSAQNLRPSSVLPLTSRRLPPIVSPNVNRTKNAAMRASVVAPVVVVFV